MESSSSPNFGSCVLALDIGGANLKASDGIAFHAARFFALWKHPDKLDDAIAELVETAPPVATWAVTMTGELADCYTTKREGVSAIIDAVLAAAARRGERPRVSVYLTDGTLVAPAEAACRYLEAAASNWHATAAFTARRFPEAGGVLIDVGSTTTDIVPFADGRVVATGRTDVDRLRCGELVYTGVVRSPICSLVCAFPTTDGAIPTAQEVFATTRDAYLMLGLLPEDVDDCQTADGRPAVAEAAYDRLARSVCADRETFSRREALQAAEYVYERQSSMLRDALRCVADRLSSRPERIVVAGQGEFLAQVVAATMFPPEAIVSLGAEFGADASRVGPAFALARLAREASPA